MKLVVISYKVCWRISASKPTHATSAGFPMQMEALSYLFDESRLVITLRQPPVADGAKPLIGHNLSVHPLPEPTSSDFRRKLALITWIPSNAYKLWKEIARADAVHALVPGDVGMLGILIALMQKKPLFVRHCGTWGEPVTFGDRILLSLLNRIAGANRVVMATGGSVQPPSSENKNVAWIHSTSLNAEEINSITPAPHWDGKEPLHLITVGRLSKGKNAEALIRALPAIQKEHPGAYVTILGDGPEMQSLQSIAQSLNCAESITFKGNVSHEDVIKNLQSAHLFVFPTKVKEGFPKAVLEAMACGLPVIAPPVSVIPHLISQGCGVLLDNPDKRSIEKAVTELAAEPEKMELMGQQGRAISHQYTLEAWQEIIKNRLETAWKRPLKDV